MASYWRVVPTFRLVRQFCRENGKALAAHQHIRNRYFGGMFRFMPWATHSELNKDWKKDFEEHRKRWEEFAKDMESSFGVKIPRYQDSKSKRDVRPGWCHRDRRAWARAAGARDQMDPKSDSPVVSMPDRDFKVSLDLSGFAPDEISVKIAGSSLRVEARHESQTQAGREVLRSYAREFVLPAEVDLDALRSRLDAEGTLNLTAPRRGVVERAVPIDVAEEVARKVDEVLKDDKETPGEAARSMVENTVDKK